MKIEQIRRRIEKEGWKIKRIINTNNLIATKGSISVLASNHHSLYRKIIFTNKYYKHYENRTN